MKKLTLLFTATIFVNVSLAQNLTDTLFLSKNMSFLEAIDTVFSNFEKDGVEILLDRSLPTLQLEEYAGQKNKNKLSADSILELYGILHLAHFDHSQWNTVFEIKKMANDFINENGVTPLMVVEKYYHKISQDAIENGWIGFDELPLTDLSPSGISVMHEQLAFGAAPLTKHDASTPYILTDDFMFIDNDYSTFLINEGSGFYEVFKDQIFYLSKINQEYIDFAMTDGTDTLFTSFQFVLKSSTSSATELPTDSCQFTANGKTHFYGVWPKCESNYTSCGDCLEKVVIIVEGFDPTNQRFFSTSVEKNNLYHIANQQNMADNLRNAGYDIVILNFADGLDPLEEQAEVVIELIEILKQTLDDCNSQHEFVVIGPSSGGIVSRYALAKMEEESLEHNTRLYVSIDVPHQGANIPLSFQHFIKFSKNTLPLNFLFSFGDLHALKETFLATPTKQLLKYHATETSGGHAYPAQEHIDFYTNLNSMNGNGWPNNCRKISIANGSGSGEDFGFSPADKLFAINFFFGVFNMITDGWAINDHSEDKEKLFSGVAFFNFLFGIIPVNIVVKKSYQSDPLDNAPGGQLDLIKELFISTEDLPICNSCSYLSPEMSEDFIPVKSAFDANVSYFYDYNMNADNEALFPYPNELSTPFDAIYASDQNEPHVIDGVTIDIANFIEKEIMYNNLYLQNRTVQTAIDFSAKETVLIGSNVTDRIPYGNFHMTTDFGYSDIRSGSEIILKDGTLLSPSNSAEIRVYIEPYLDCFSASRLSSQDEENSTNENEENKQQIINSNRSFSLYPNPCRNEFTISLFEHEPTDRVSYQLIDIQGRVIISQTINRKVCTVDVSTLQNGVYILRMDQNGKISQEQVVKIG